MGDEAREWLTAEQLYRDLVAAHRQCRPPKGWVTAKDFAQDTGLSVSRAREVLNERVAAGTMQAGEYPAPNGRARALYYGFVVKGED